MSDPRRWRDDPNGQVPGAGILLRGARRPQPPGAHALERLGAAIDAMARRPAAPPASWLRLAVAGAIAFAIVGGGTFVWALHARNEQRAAAARAGETPRVAQVARPRPAVVAMAQPVAAPSTPARAAVPAAPAARPARRHVAEARVASAPAPEAPAAAPTDALAREIPLIDAARSDLATSPARALASLEAHRRQFPRGQLAAERDFLAVQALLQTSRMADAKQRAAELASRYPSSSYAARAARLIEDVETRQR
ncbi:MAG TPA: hypothetical protein VIF57_06160 [Polyangia bacterium]|jgi:hypothetical protein